MSSSNQQQTHPDSENDAYNESDADKVNDEALSDNNYSENHNNENRSSSFDVEMESSRNAEEPRRNL